MEIKYEVARKLIEKNMVKELDFIDLSYANTRLIEVNNDKLHKQRSDGICPCIKTNIQNYGVVVYDKD